jgi:hypothetical protein
LAGGKEPGQIVGREWDPHKQRWRPITGAEIDAGQGPSAEGSGPEVPDHLPDDFG